MNNKRANYTLSAVLGIAGVLCIIIPFLLKDISNWFALLGGLFLYLAFLANR